ncbi:MAG: tetratricopeptide repeat protein, partial [Chloroflexota bacterium]
AAKMGGPAQPRGAFPPPPLHGFHGRARELLDLERAFATRNIVVLHGFGGQGKTALATQAAEWFTRTHLFDRAAFVSFENGVGLDFVLNELGEALVEENFQIHQGDKTEAIAESLREKPALVVFDNFESILPNGNAPLSPEELQKLLDAAARWFPAGLDTAAEVEWTKSVSRPRRLLDQRRSCMLITTRNPNIPNPAFSPSKNCLHKELEGLAPSDALELAASILEAYSLPRPPRLPLEALLAFLKGHPLSLQLALPQLRNYSAEQLVEQYQTILPSIKVGEARERNESLEVSLRFSLDRLGEEAKTLLTRLSVFEGGAFELALLAITEIPEDKWNALKPQLTSTALIRVEELEGVTVPFIHFHPTLAPHLRAQPESQSNYQLLITNYWKAYYQLSRELYQLDTQHPIQARSIVRRELPNLKRALHLALEAGALDEAVEFAECINRFLDVFGRWRERDEVASQVERAMEKERGKHALSSVEGKKEGGITKSEFLLESGRGQRLLQQGRAGEAEKVFRALLARLEGEAAYDTRYDQTLILRNIGLSLRAQGRPSQAADFYRRAIGLAEGLEQTDNVRGQIGFYHADLADVLRDLGNYAEARTNYEKSLEIAQKEGNDRSAGVALGQLGTLAMRQGDLNEARKRHLEALGLFQRMGEDQSEAVAWHQLGMVAQEARDWDEAERCYKESVNIEEKLGHAEGVAQTCNQLAIVAQNAGRPAEAERWYLRAIEIHEKMGRQQELAVMLSNLANLYLSQNRLDEAETYARRALAIMETLDLSAQPWTTYNILAQLAEKRGRMDEARAWRRKEQESFAAFAGSDYKLKQLEPVIGVVVAACQGNKEAQQALDTLLGQLEGSGDENLKGFADIIRRILQGERDFSEILANQGGGMAALVQRILQALNGESAPHPPAHLPSSEGSPIAKEQAIGEGGQAQGQQGITIPQLLELVERAAGGDHELGGKLFPMLQQMARDPNAPQEIQAFANVLVRVMAGVRDPDLSSLPDELASAVRGMLGRLKNK